MGSQTKAPTVHLKGACLVCVQGLWSGHRLSQELVERLLHAHTNLVLRESLDATHHHLLPWDIDVVIGEPKHNPKSQVYEKMMMWCLFKERILRHETLLSPCLGSIKT